MVWFVGILIFILMCFILGDVVYCIVVGCYGYDYVNVDVVFVVCVELGLDCFVFEFYL